MPFRGLYNLFKIKISMKINIKTTVAALVLALVLPLHAQAQGAGRAAKPKKKIKWTSMAPKLGDAKCAPLWARFYTIEDNRPFFSDRDSVIKFDISEIGYERRNGYKWFNSDWLEVFERYETWHKKYGAAAAE